MATALRPKEGIPVRIGGIEFHFLFTFAVIDELQETYKEPFSEIIKKLMDPVALYSAAGHIVHALIASDIYNNGGKDIEPPTYADIMHVLEMSDAQRIVATILRAYGLDMPEKEEDDEEDEEDDGVIKDSEQINIARLLVIGKTELGMSEAEFWNTTPRKFFLLFDEYVKYKNGGKKPNDGGGIDDLP